MPLFKEANVPQAFQIPLEEYSKLPMVALYRQSDTLLAEWAFWKDDDPEYKRFADTGVIFTAD